MATISDARHRQAEKTYKIKYKAVKEWETGTPHKEFTALFPVPKNTLSKWKKNKGKFLQTYEIRLVAKRVKSEK